MPDIADFAIVGYGPVGQSLAIALAQRGHRVLVLERATGLHPLPRAVGFDHETARILQSLGLAEALPGFTAPCERYEWRNATGCARRVTCSLLCVADTTSQPCSTSTCAPKRRSRASNACSISGWQKVSLSGHPEIPI